MSKYLFVLMWGLWIISCSAPTPEKFLNDQPLYEYAIKLFQNKDYSESLPFFDSLRTRFPQSPYAVDSELKIADCHFEKTEYAEAEISYSMFRSLHPTHPAIPHVVFRLGLTQYKRIPRGIDRDQSYTEKAIMYFGEFVQQWPQDPNNSQAKNLIKKCKKYLAEREMYIVNFYLHRNQYNAALVRLETIHNNKDFQEFEELRLEATYKLGFAHYKLNNTSEAISVLSELINNPKAEKFKTKAESLLTRIEKLEHKKE